MNDNLAHGFLEFIIEHPDDDTARLVFADWLEEQGDFDRSEFIRVQIERARLPEWDARQVGLRLREQELLTQHGRRWMAELPRIDGMIWKDFRRGFVARATFFDYETLRKTTPSCWAAAPIEAITVRWPRRNDPIESIEVIAGLREIFIDAKVVDQNEVSRLAGSPLLSTLRALNVRDCSLGVEGFRRLVASPHLGNLTALRLPNNLIGNGGVGALHNAVSLTSLTELDLSESGVYGRYGEDPIIEAAGMEMLAAWRGLNELRSLTLSGNNIGQAGLRALLRSPRVSGLTQLVLRGNGLNGAAMEEFAAAQSALRLVALDLGGNVLDDLGATELAKAECLGELKELNLDRCEIHTPGACEVTGTPFVANLERLNIEYNVLGPEGLHALLTKKPEKLHTLQIRCNNLGDDGALRLASSPASDTLLDVDLSLNGLGDAAVQALASSKHLRNLQILRLNYNSISRHAADGLRASPLGKRLSLLEPANLGDAAVNEDIPF